MENELMEYFKNNKVSLKDIDQKTMKLADSDTELRKQILDSHFREYESCFGNEKEEKEFSYMLEIAKNRPIWLKDITANFCKNVRSYKRISKFDSYRHLCDIISNDSESTNVVLDFYKHNDGYKGSSCFPFLAIISEKRPDLRKECLDIVLNIAERNVSEYSNEAAIMGYMAFDLRHYCECVPEAVEPISTFAEKCLDSSSKIVRGKIWHLCSFLSDYKPELTKRAFDKFFEAKLVGRCSSVCKEISKRDPEYAFECLKKLDTLISDDKKTLSHGLTDIFITIENIVVAKPEFAKDALKMYKSYLKDDVWKSWKTWDGKDETSGFIRGASYGLARIAKKRPDLAKEVLEVYAVGVQNSYNDKESLDCVCGHIKEIVIKNYALGKDFCEPEFDLKKFIAIYSKQQDNGKAEAVVNSEKSTVKQEDINKITDDIHNLNIFNKMADTCEKDDAVEELDSLYGQLRGNVHSEVIKGLISGKRFRNYGCETRGKLFHLTRLLDKTSHEEALTAQLYLSIPRDAYFEAKQFNEGVIDSDYIHEYICSFDRHTKEGCHREKYIENFAKTGSEEFVRNLVQDYAFRGNDKVFADVKLLDYIKKYCIDYGFDQEGLKRACENFIYPTDKYDRSWCVKGYYPDELRTWAEETLPKTGGKQRRYIEKEFDDEKIVQEIISSGISLADKLSNSDKRLIQEIPFDTLKKIVERAPSIIDIPGKQGEKLETVLKLEKNIDSKKVKLLLDNNAEMKHKEYLRFLDTYISQQKADNQNDTLESKAPVEVIKADNQNDTLESKAPVEAIKAESSNTEARLEEERARTAVAEKELAEIQQKLQETRQALSESEQKTAKEKDMFLEGTGISKLTPNERRELFVKSAILRKEHPVMQEVALTTMCRCYVEEKDKKAKLGFLKTLYQIRKGGETRQEKNEMADTFARVLDKAPELKKDENLVALSKRDTVVSQPTKQVRRQVESAGK